MSTRPIADRGVAMKSILRILTVTALVAFAAPQAQARGGSCDAKAQAKAGSDIIDTALAAGNFQTLAAALTQAGLIDALKGEGPFTVFAPTDEAFAKLPEGTVASLLKPENRDKLATILKYHVVSGRVYSDEVLARKSVSTLAGIDVQISLKNGQARADEALIVATDIDATNGVIHVIDQVLLPSEDRMSRANASALIEMAIGKGAPMYNHGNAAACAALYEMTANALIALDGELPQDARLALSNALVEMNDSHDSSDQAWIMRRGLDRAYAAMTMEGISQ